MKGDFKMGKKKDFYVQVPYLTAERLKRLALARDTTLSEAFTYIFQCRPSSLWNTFFQELPILAPRSREITYPEAIIVRVDGKKVELPFPDELKYAYAKASVGNKKEVLHLHLTDDLIQGIKEISSSLDESVPKFVTKIIDTRFYYYVSIREGDTK